MTTHSAGCGLTALAFAAGMVHWGDRVLPSILMGWFGIVYWLACLGLAFVALAFGLAGLRTTWQIHRRERTEHPAPLRYQLPKVG